MMFATSREEYVDSETADQLNQIRDRLHGSPIRYSANQEKYLGESSEKLDGVS